MKGLVDYVGGTLDSIEEKLPEWRKAGSELVGGLLQSIRDKAGEFWTAGYDLMLSFGRGILHLQHWIADVMRDLMNRAVWAALDALRMGSPSKVFLELGENVDLAFAQGIRSLGHLPAIEMGRVAAGTMQSVSQVTTYNQQYNLTVNSALPVEPIVQDFPHDARVW